VYFLAKISGRQAAAPRVTRRFPPPWSIEELGVCFAATTTAGSSEKVTTDCAQLTSLQPL